MKLLLSGEGPTDIGHMQPSIPHAIFAPGPMAVIIDKLLEADPRINYSLLEAHQLGGECIQLVHESELAFLGKQANRKKLRLPGPKYGVHNIYFTRNAETLGTLAAEQQTANPQIPIIAILFRDADGTNTSSSQEWQQKFDSIKRGFELSGFQRGVPMLPRPKSEAWLLCALRSPRYQNCEALEDAPGNDNSPNSLKSLLENVIGPYSADDLTQRAQSNQIDPSQISMSSFNAFKEALSQALS